MGGGGELPRPPDSRFLGGNRGAWPPPPPPDPLLPLATRGMWNCFTGRDWLRGEEEEGGSQSERLLMKDGGLCVDDVV